MSTKQIFADLTIEVKDSDQVWPAPIIQPAHNVPKGLIMYAAIRCKRAGYKMNEIIGRLFRYFEGKGYVVVSGELEKVYKNTERLIGLANGVNARNYPTQSEYKDALKALDPDITQAMADDWTTNIKSAKSVSTYSELQETFPTLDP